MSKLNGLKIMGLMASCACLSLASPAFAETTEEKVERLERQLASVMQELQSIKRGGTDGGFNRQDKRSYPGGASAQDPSDIASMGGVFPAAGGATDTTIVSHGEPNVKFSVSGHVNRAMNLVDDGKNTQVYHIDNDVLNSRIRFEGEADVGNGNLITSRLELGLSPNNSYDVNQNTETSSAFFDQRKVEVQFKNDKYGRVSLGKGRTASDDIAELDYSLVAGSIMYSGVADPVGGMLFTDGSSLTSTSVGDVFFNFDGNGRANRVMYETPTFGPLLQLAASSESGDAYSLSFTMGHDYGNWTGIELGDFLAIAGVAYSDDGSSNLDYRLSGSTSFLHLPTGVSLSLSAGKDEKDTGGDDPFNLYGKLAWDTQFWDIGSTGFGIDYTHTEDNCSSCDEGQSFGIAGLQTIDDFGIELYGQYRFFSVDTDTGTQDFDDMHAITIGAKAKF